MIKAIAKISPKATAKSTSILFDLVKN